MKKFSLFIILILLITMLCGCGNMSMGVGNYEYKKVHVDTYHNSGCYTVKKWYDASTGIEVLTEEVGSLYLSEGIYIMVEKDCPFCDTEE